MHDGETTSFCFARARLKKQNAPEAVGLRTRECYSALNAMRRSRRERNRDSIYPRYSGVTTAATRTTPRASPTCCARVIAVAGSGGRGCLGKQPAACLAGPPWVDRRHDPRASQPFAPTERWQSGRSHRTRNAAYGQPYRGFESLPLRHIYPYLYCKTNMIHDLYPSGRRSSHPGSLDP